jgi:hypothetical protein
VAKKVVFLMDAQKKAGETMGGCIEMRSWIFGKGRYFR